MPGAIATAWVEVRPDTDEFGKELETKTLGVVRTIGQAIASVQLGRYLADGLGEFEEARDISAQTAAAIRSTGAAANVTEEDVGSLADRLSRLAAVDDDLIQKGSNLLLTFTRVRNEVGEGNDVFDQGVEAALDMSAAMGTDLNNAALQVGKALNDPIRGITALQRAGVQLTDQQKEQIRTFVESGDILSAQKVILEELETQFGGSAAAQASGLDRINVAMGNLKESIGGVVAPLAEQAVPVVERLVDIFEELPGPVQTGVVALAGIGVAARPINEVVALTRTLRGSTEGAAGGMTRLGRAGAALAALGIAATLAEISDEATGLSVDLERAAEATTDELLASFRRLGGVEGSEAIRFFESLANGSDATYEAARQMRDELARTGADVSELDAILEDAGEAHGRNADRTREGADALSEFEGAAEGAGEAASGAAGDVEELGTANLTAAESALEHESAIRSLSDRISAFTSEALAGPQAIAAWEEAIDGLTASIAENGATLDLNTEQGRANFDAGVEVAEGLGALIQARFDETGSVRAATEAGQLHVERLKEELRQAGLSEEAIQNYVDTLRLVPGDYIANMKLNTAEAVAALQAFQRELAGVAENSYEVDITARRGPGGGTARAGGGPVYAGEAYWTGERGPEPFFPAQDGRILSREDAMAAMAGGRGGFYVAPGAIQQNYYGDRNAGADLRRELDRQVLLASAGGW